MSNLGTSPGLNAIYNGAFAEGLNIGNSIGLGKGKRSDLTHTMFTIKKKGNGRKRKGGRRHKR